MLENPKDLEVVAGEKNIEQSNAIVDDVTNEVIDIEALLQQDTPVAYKINNLMKCGVSIEQVKKVYEAITAGGTTIEQALEELDKVFFVLAKGITNSPNELVIDMTTGRIDPVATRDRIIELGLSEEYFDYSHKTKLFVAPEIDTSIDTTLKNFLGKESTSMSDMIKQYNDLEEYREYLNSESYIPPFLRKEFIEKDLSSYADAFDEVEYGDDNDDYNYEVEDESPEANFDATVEINENGVKYGGIEVPKTLVKALNLKSDESSIDTFEELYAFGAIFSYARDYERKESVTRSLNKLKTYLPLTSGRYAPMLEGVINESGEVDLEKLLAAQKEFEHIRNEGSVAKNLFKILHGQTTNKVDILKTLARSFLHEDDNPEIIEAARIIAEANGVKYNKEAIMQAVTEATGIAFDNYEAFQAYAVGKELSTKTFEGKFFSIETTLKKDALEGKIPKSRTQQSMFSKRNAAKKLSENELFLSESFSHIINEFSVINEETGLNYRGHEILAAYKYFRDQTEGKKGPMLPEAKMIEAYMKEHRKEFIDYFVRYTDINPYHVRGNLDFDAIKDILEISPLPEHSKAAVDKIITSTKQTAVVIQTKSKQDVVKKIESIYLETVEKGKPLSENHVNAVKALLGRLNYSKLQPDFIAAVENMHPDIKEFMNIRRAEMEIAEKARIEIAGKQSKTNAIEETVELLEAKLKVFSGTPFYGKVIQERKAFYKNNPKADEFRKKLYGKNGQLSEKGNEKVDKYISEYKDKKILDHIKGIDYKQLRGKEKENFSKWLLVGLNSDNKRLVELAEGYLKEMNPELYSCTDQFQFKFRAYKTVYPEMKSYDEVMDKEEILTENLTKLALKESIVYTEEKITDKNFQEFYERHAEIFEATATDLDITEMQTYFANSKITFSDKEDQLFAELYKNSTIDSWLSTKGEASEMLLVSLLKLKERAENIIESKVEGDNTGRKSIEYIDGKINKLLEKYPNLKDTYIDENGDVKQELFDKGDVFFENKITSDILKGFSRNLFGNVQEYDSELERMVEVRKVYMNILVGLRHAKDMKDPAQKEMIEKLSYRALEMMNTDDVKVISFGEKGEVNLNEEEILKIFRNNKNDFSSLDELMEAKYEQYRTVYMYKKMRDYDSKDFFALESKTPEEQIVEIETIKRNQKAKYKKEEKKKKESANKSKSESKESESKSKKEQETSIVKKTKNRKNMQNIKAARSSRKDYRGPKISSVAAFASEGRQFAEEEKASINTLDTGAAFVSSGMKSVVSASNKETIETTGATVVSGVQSVIARNEENLNQTTVVEEKVEYANESAKQGTSTLQAEEFNVAEVEAPEETKKDFFKPLKDWWKRMTTPKLGDGKDTTKKPGIFSKLFGKKDRDEEITEGETKEKPKEENSITESKKTFEEEIKVGFDGRLEQSVSNSSNGSKTTMIQNQVENENQSSLEEI